VLILNPYGKRPDHDDNGEGSEMRDTGYPASHIPDPTSLIPHPASRIPHPVSRGFHVPYINSRIALPLVWAGVAVVLYFWNPVELTSLKRLMNFTFDRDDLPLFLFIIAAIILTVMGIIRKLSLIPVLGLLSSLFLMAHLGFTNWMRFLVWLILGMMIYVFYSHRHSRLRNSHPISNIPDPTSHIQHPTSKI